jgi:hypothetical protein
MLSPFPGMDPWLESPYIWPDFHNRFAYIISDSLNERLPRPYYARLEMRPEIGVVEDEGGYVRRIVPDVSVVRHPEGESTVALAEPATRLSESLEVTITVEPIDHPMIEVRDPSQGHRLVTLIEIVSPANKSAGQDRDAYFKKQSEVLTSDASLVEIDLLRGGKRLFAAPELVTLIAQRPQRVDYVALVNRAWKRDRYQVFPMSVTESLAVAPLPLRKGQPEMLLNLQEFFQLAYAGGPYARGAVDYSKPPHPPLPPELTSWAEECLRKAKVIA